MSSTTQPTDFSDLYTDLMNRMRADTSLAASVVIAKRLIQSAHMDLYVGNGEKFHWAERRASLTLHAQYTTGTLSATIGSGTITGSSTAWNTANDHGQNNMRVGGKMTIAGSETVYTVTAVASDTSATISPNYIGDTDSGLSYSYFEDEYSLASDYWKPIDQQSFDWNRQIRLVGRTDFRRWYPRNRIPQTDIRIATIVDHPFSGDTTPIRKVRFAPPPSNTQVIPYAYVTSNIVVSSSGTGQSSFSADADEPIMPLRYRHVIVYKALVEWYRDRKDDGERSREARGEYASLLERMIGDQDIGAQRLSLSPAVGVYRARARRPWRRGTGRYDFDGEFDRLER